jgi:lipoic acid synthetase
MGVDGGLRVRWLGRVRYRDAWALQRRLFERSGEQYLLLLEHPHVFTLGVRALPEHVLVDPATIGAEVVSVDRGGDVTYHGPGQLVGYPIVDVPDEPGAGRLHARRLESLVIAALERLGVPDVGRMAEYPGVWVGPGTHRPRKIAAIGTRVTRGRTLHGFALNVAVDLDFFRAIVPCGIAEYPVTSLDLEGVRVSVGEVADVVAELAPEVLGVALGDIASVDSTVLADLAARRERRPGPTERSEPSRPETPRPPLESTSSPIPARVEPPSVTVSVLGRRRLEAAGVDPDAGLPVSSRKPPWLRSVMRLEDGYRSTQRVVRSAGLVTVCEEAGCPNISECWAEGTATFMINGERCTRSCGFCLVDTRHPVAPDPGEPERVADAVARLGLSHAVVTAVARDDLTDGGASGFVSTIRAIRRRQPTTAVEVLIPDCKGDEAALGAIFAERPDVLNHNVETVARLQRAVRPQASYGRSLSVLARAKEAGLVTKSGIMVGLGEREDEVLVTLLDLAAIGVDIVTIGQYLRPTARHLPVQRWWAPEDFDRLRAEAEAMGFAHVEASPLTRSSYHARRAAGGLVAAQAQAAMAK